MARPYLVVYEDHGEIQKIPEYHGRPTRVYGLARGRKWLGRDSSGWEILCPLHAAWKDSSSVWNTYLRGIP